MSSPFTRTFTFRKLLRTIGVFTIVLVTLAYIAYQARNIIQGPALTLTGDYTAVQHEKIITLTGTTHNIVKLTLNGKEIHTDEAGVFSHDVVLENGYTIMTLAAEDRFGRTTSVVREYVYVPIEGTGGGV
jgi:hypothetical protein